MDYFSSHSANQPLVSGAPTRLPPPTNLTRPRLTAVTDARTFQSIRTQLYDGWEHEEKDKPQLLRVFEIEYPEKDIAAYRKYRDSVDVSGIFSPPMTPGNERLGFHGTNRACLLGDNNDNLTLCTATLCSLCSIIRTSFMVNRCGTKHGFMRFGKGVYTTTCSSKADDYTAQKPAGSSPNKAMLLCRQVLGKSHILRLDAPHLISPPPGFHSVLGEKGLHLNYSESVIYNDDAIRPAYLIVYRIKPVEKKPRLRDGVGQGEEAVPSGIPAISGNAFDDVYGNQFDQYTAIEDTTHRYVVDAGEEWNEYDPTPSSTDWQTSYVFDEEFPDLDGGQATTTTQAEAGDEIWQEEAF